MTFNLQPDAKNRYFDPHQNCWATKLLPGEFHVTDSGEMLVTTLGSCVSACIRDSRTGVGGMNHFMLPSSRCGEWAGQAASTRYGNFAMEHMVNEILKKGGRREFLEATILGGGVMFGDGSTLRVGENNATFAREYLTTEKIRLIGEDIGGSFSRKVYFYPQSGQVVVKKLKVLKNDTIAKREEALENTLAHLEIESDVELFDVAKD